MHSFTTQETADELEILRLWHDVILQTDLLPEQKLLARQRKLFLRLLTRQKPDGSFAALPSDQTASDLAVTSAALTALAQIDDPLAKQATENATNWLHRQLDNSWFSEEEREDRAAAYAALATANRTDSANLHYFSDTSADKNLSPLATAELALAFAKSGDQDKAGVWLSKIKLRNSEKEATSSTYLWPLLAENNFYDTAALMSSIEKIADNNLPFAQAANTLRAMWSIQNRAGTWQATINKSEFNVKSILIAAPTEKTAALSITNPNDRPIYVTATNAQKTPSSDDNNFSRHIYRPYGIELMANDALESGGTYIVVTEGPWPSHSGDEDSVLVHEGIGPALNPVSCTIDNHFEAGDELGWIKNLSLTAAALCEKSGTALDIVLQPRQKDSKNWAVAYLAKAERSGTFSVSPIEVSITGDDIQNNGARCGPRTKIRVQ